MGTDNYRKPYYFLFNKISDGLKAMEELNFGQARSILMEAQVQAEEFRLEISSEEDKTET